MTWRKWSSSSPKTAAHKDDLKEQTEHFNQKFAEQAINPEFYRKPARDICAKILDSFQSGQKEDDGAFVKDLFQAKKPHGSIWKAVKKA